MNLMVTNILKMPIWLKFLSILGVISPILALTTVMTSDYHNNKGTGVALAIAIVLSMVPVFVASIMMMLKSKQSRVVFLFGWLIVCVSPLLMQSVRSELDLFIMEFSFNLLIGVALAAYLFKSKQVQEYFGN
jgi:hypothetical protein